MTRLPSSKRSKLPRFNVIKHETRKRGAQSCSKTDRTPRLGQVLQVIDHGDQDVVRAAGQNAQGEVDGLVAHHRVHSLDRAGLPGAQLGHYGVGTTDDELGTDLRGVLVGQ